MKELSKMSFLELVDAIHSHKENFISGFAEHTKKELGAMSIKDLINILTKFMEAK